MIIFLKILWHLALMVWGVAFFEWIKVQRIKDKGYKEVEKAYFWTIILLISSLLMMIITFFIK